jgi:hypothetical protein
VYSDFDKKILLLSILVENNASVKNRQSFSSDNTPLADDGNLLVGPVFLVTTASRIGDGPLKLLLG